MNMHVFPNSNTISTSKLYRRGFSLNTTPLGEVRYSPSNTDHVYEFYALVEKWRSETKFTSNIDQILDHPAYRKIVSYGENIIPYILLELKKEPSLIVFALEDIIGKRQYNTEEIGNVRKMTEAWLLWANTE